MSSDSFLGTGWSFPPSFDIQAGSVETVAGEDDIRQSLYILLSTGLNERVMYEDYGCQLSRFLFGEVSQYLITSIREAVSKAIENHEPRIEIDRISVDQDADDLGVLYIDIYYTVKAKNSRHNLVYPFYINEATNI